MLDHNMIELLRAAIAEQAQMVYDSYIKRPSEYGGGICDEITERIIDLLYNNLEDVKARIGGWDGDDHAPVVAVIQGATYFIDIPWHIYERKRRAYSWKLIPGVRFSSNDVVFERVEGFIET